MSILLWLDDIRKPPKGYLWVRTAKEAIQKLYDDDITFASLDHDLNPDQYNVFTRFNDDSDYKDDTGMSVLKWMRDNDKWPKDGVEIHSSNIPKRIEMINFCKKHLPDDKIFVKIFIRA